MTGKKPSAQQRYVSAFKPRIERVPEFLAEMAMLAKLLGLTDGLPQQVTSLGLFRAAQPQDVHECYGRAVELGRHVLAHNWPVERAKAIALIEKAGHQVHWNDPAQQAWMLGFRVSFAHPNDDSTLEII